MITVLRYLPIVAVIAAALTFVAFEPDRFRLLEVQWSMMLLSSLLLYLFFWFRALTWHWYLREIGIVIGFRKAATSLFITVLTKYIPGKVWPILSMAAHVHSPKHRYRDSLANIGWYQIAIVLSGIGVGTVGLFAISGQTALMLMLPPAIVLLVGWSVGRRWFVRMVVDPLVLLSGLSIRPARCNNVALFLFCILHWIVMSGAYWLMFRSVELEIGPFVALSQSFANVIGILVPFAPAGLGVREAAGAGYLATQIPDAGSALIYVSLARAWSFCIEVAVFCTGLAVRPRT